MTYFILLCLLLLLADESTQAFVPPSKEGYNILDRRGISVLSQSTRSSTTSRITLFNTAEEKVVGTTKITSATTETTAAIDTNIDIDTATTLEELCTYLDATPRNLLTLGTSQNGEERGVYLNDSVSEDDIILKLPLSSCIRDDKPPIWYDTYKSLHRNHDFDEDNFHYNPSKWATRLAATLLDLQIRYDDEKENPPLLQETSQTSSTMIGLQKWLDMMPDEEYLRASLPIHWPQEIISKTKCTALELLVDASYFARAEAISDLVAASNVDDSDESIWGGIDLADYNIEEMASSIFDIVQTRSCRAERTDGGIQIRPSLRILAPIFDYINHGSCHHEGEGSANAYFGLEGDDEKDLSLVVRARRDIEAKEEVLIDYGDSARPPFRCLASYGFVPEFRKGDDTGDESIAEVYMDGIRYEVTSHTVPYEMVEAAAAASYIEDDDENENENETLLTPEIALRIAKRVSDAAFQLLIDTESTQKNKNEENEDAARMKIASKLASSLRWSQHQVLLACALGLRDYAESNSNE